MDLSISDYFSEFAPSFLSSHSIAVVQAVLVTFLWSSSYVFIKIGLNDIPSLTFAGLRYSLAFICMIPLVLRSKHRREAKKLTRKEWLYLAVLGIIYYSVTQGAQFAALVHLPAVTVSLMLNFTPVIVTMLGIAFLSEYPNGRQWIGMIIAVVGAVFYFYPIALPFAKVIGLGIMVIALLANSGSSVLGRYVNRGESVSPIVVTTVSMGIGSIVLLVAGIGVQGLPNIGLQGWIIVVWLAVVNTAFAFTLWNHTLQTLTAMESSIINNTMLIQIAILGWVFLGETLRPLEVVALLIVAFGTLLVQIRRA